MKKSELRQIIREEILKEDTYTSNVKNRDEFYKELNKLIKKIKSRWGDATLKGVSVDTKFKRSIFKRIKQKFKNTAPIFLTVKLLFKDEKKSPVEYVTISGVFIEKPSTKLGQLLSGFDVTPSEGWEGGRGGALQTVKNDSDLEMMFVDNEEYWAEHEGWGK